MMVTSPAAAARTLTQDVKSSSYPLASVKNSSGAPRVTGTVSYAACRNDSYDITIPSMDWTASSRGLCLLTKVSATVYTDRGVFEATPYTSSGTSYSQFAVISANGGYAVTRIVN